LILLLLELPDLHPGTKQKIRETIILFIIFNQFKLKILNLALILQAGNIDSKDLYDLRQNDF